MHVLADALTSILAIAALLAGRYGGWVWMDPLMGVVGAVVIGRWSWGLIAETGQVLLDGEPTAAKEEALRAAIEADSDNRIADLHLWRVGPEQHAAIVSVVTHDPRPPQHYKDLLSAIPGLAHVTVEVNPCTAEDCA